MRSLLLSLSLAMLLPQTVAAATITLDFAEETIGRRDDPFVSVECGCVQLSGSAGLRIYLTDEGDIVLVAGADLEGGNLVLDFLVPVAAVELDFGGDASADEVESRPARLRGFAGGVEVALAELEPNRNLLIDQTLTINPGVVIDSAVFTFSQLGEYEPYSAYIGRIELTTVPEPPLAVPLAFVGLVFVGAARRKRGPPTPCS
jgi:hypothetical protein